MSNSLRPLVPSFLRAALSGSKPVEMTYGDVSDTNISSTSSFIYDVSNAPLKSTQQLNVDWSDFVNHTFFMSAEAKTNIAFDKIINGYPFDGTRLEVEKFFEDLSGFEKWVFDQFPTHRGQLHFSGSAVGETASTAGTYVKVSDYAGGLFPEISKKNDGESLLNPGVNDSLSIEMQLYLPTIWISGTQTVCQKMSGSTQGFSLYLTSDSSNTSATAVFAVVSGSTYLSASMTLTKGQFNHICVTLNKDVGVHYLQAYNQENLVAESLVKNNISLLDINQSDFIIGSGSAVTLGSTVVTPTQTLSGVIDEFRVFHSVRTKSQQSLYAAKPIFASNDLKLYFKFNEPSGTLGDSASSSINSIVLDSSGNALHAYVSNISAGSRQNAENDTFSKVIFEKNESCPVLFSGYDDIITLNTTLLTSASAYDQDNPNLITKLVPSHYLLEGAASEGFEEIEGNAATPYTGDWLPGDGRLGNVQIMLSLLYTWARFFDDIKLYVDTFSTVRYVDYETNDTVSSNFLYDLVKHYGFHLPPLFNNSTIDQYVRAENIDQGVNTNEYSLKYVQSQLLRRVLTNISDIIKSKGTQHSIKSFLRAVGIDPDNSLKIREYGGPTKRSLTYSRETKKDVMTMVEFTSSSLVITPFLSSSRTEPGYPGAIGSFVKASSFPPIGISNNRNDGLLTSGSWSFESLIKYTPINVRNMTSSTQSLARLCVTGTVSSSVGLVANFLLMSSSIDPKLRLYVRSGDSSSSPTLSLDLPISGNMFDGNHWNVCFGCTRNDEISSIVSSSYFIKAGVMNAGEIEWFATTSSFFLEKTSEVNVFRQLTTSSNTSGAFLAIGPNQTLLSGTSSANGYLFLNDTSIANEARSLDFSGMMSNVRFWSKSLTDNEWLEHVKNYKSTGVEDPFTNFNYNRSAPGSFQRLRLNGLMKQTTRRANSTSSLGTLGSITFIDFSQNGLHLTGSGFPLESDCVKPDIIYYSHISPYYDEAATSDKIRVRSFQDQTLVDITPWASVAPVSELIKSEQPLDDPRFSIDFSLVDALNRDIVNIFATLDSLDNALGDPTLENSPDYPSFETISNVYFNRLVTKLNFRAFFDFFKWFDDSIGTFIEQLIPRKTKFKGTNFVIESHMLERHKVQYYSSEMYLSESERVRYADSFLLQQVEGTLKKY